MTGTCSPAPELFGCNLCVQVIKAAVAQVKAVADGGVTAADLTQAK